ncbi:MAG: hypothetical protein JWO02_2614, partial [Solirubrobacterales bacterium]|nr:hypothetical protein [Solirubrobacterales bacterium]
MVRLRPNLLRPRALIAAFALAFVAVAAHASVGQAATRYVAPSGSGSACTVGAPCASWNSAYAAAAPGDTVEVAAGTYPSQTFTAANKTSGAQVSFVPSGGTVTVGTLNIWRSRIAVSNMKVQDVTIRKEDVGTPPAVSNVTITNLDGRNFNIFDATDVSIIGGDWGPASSCGGPYGGGNNSLRRIAGTVPTHILIDGVRVHDVQSYDLNACHTEGLAIFAGSDVTVRNSKFYGNSIYDIFVQDNSGPIDTITLENNWFAAPVGTT